MEQLRAKKGFIIDMDGVIYHGNRLLPGAKEFVEWLYREEKEFLFLTNSSRYTPKELQKKPKQLQMYWVRLSAFQEYHKERRDGLCRYQSGYAVYKYRENLNRRNT